jgi:hypothetical protein
MISAVLAVLILSTIYLFMQISKEKKRNRILQAFMSGIIDSVQKCIYAVDTFDKEEDSIEEDYYEQCYYEILRSIGASVEADLWPKPLKKWLSKDRKLFFDKKYANGGFNRKYLDLFDMELTESIKKI